MKTLYRSLLALGTGAEIVLALGCQVDEREPRVGSETHFLTWCRSDGSCAGSLECICGTCVSACEREAECSGLSRGASCQRAFSANASCTDAGLKTACDVTCQEDSDCLALSPEHRCDVGHCRRLSSDCDAGGTEPTEVVFLGDNFLANSGQVVALLEERARQTGALETAASYRDHSSTLTTPFGGTMDLFSQFAAALQAGAVRTVILDAGGPDALLSCPEPASSDCAGLADAASGFRSLLQTFASEGVTSAIVFFYPDPADTSLKSKFDVLRPMMQAVCEESELCSFLDLRSIFSGNEGRYLMTGGILPTEEGASATADLIWTEMGRRCIGQ